MQPRFDRPGSDSRVVDPVCFMRVLPTTPFEAAHEGRRFHFCSERCLNKFRENSNWYVSSAMRRKLPKRRRPPLAGETETIFAV